MEGRRLALPTGLKDVVLPNGQRIRADLGVIVVRLTDADGAQGYSLVWAQQERLLVLFEAGLQLLGPQLRGTTPHDGESVVTSLRGHLGFVGWSGAGAFATSGLEMAVQDLLCRRRGVSLARALGKRSDTVRAYQTGLMLGSAPEDLVTEAKAIYAGGVKAIKMIVGKPDLEEDLERIGAVKAALPADATLMVDALQHWDPAAALRAAEAFAPLGLAWLEDPIGHHDLAGYRELVVRSPVPIATGESLFEEADFRALVDAGVPYVIAELERVGGISQWMRTAELVSQGEGVLLPHIYPHVSAQLIAALNQREAWWEYVPWFNGLVPGRFELRDGLLVVSDQPGSGFDPDPDAIERFARADWLDLASG
ncbi:MAG: hypothetical protein ABS80_01065 [Pseudonocardia sp. SCN 72-51]|nr:MAG: hypothetical protein ABS80_01065 [Pseudonocardia sp. SCN 72-51]